MNYTELIKKTSKKSLVSQRQTKDVIEALIYTIIEGVYNGEEVHVRNLGKFLPFTRHARKGVDPHTLEPITIPAVTVAKFRVASAFKKIIKSKK